MPMSVDDDIETALLGLAAVYKQMEGETFTGKEVAASLQTIAGMLHRARQKRDLLLKSYMEGKTS